MFLVDSDLSNRAVKLGFSKGISVVTRRKMRNNESENLGLGLDTNNKKFLQKLGGLNLNSNLQSEGFSGCVLAISIGRRLMIVEIVLKDVNNASLVVLKEIQCVDGDISTMVWIDDSIIVGTANGYSLISCVGGLSSVIFSLPDVSRPPRLKLLYRDWRVLLLVDNVGIIVDEKGQPVGGSLVFRRGLDSVGELSFYVVVVSDGKIELYNKKSGGCVQVLPFGGEGIGPCVIASEEDKGGKLVAVATATKVVCYQKLPSVDQIKDLLRKKNYKGAISLVEELEYEGEMSNELLSFVHAQVGFLLLFDLHFEEAVNHFLLSETMQPSEIFPFIMRDPNRWSLLRFKLAFVGS